MSLVEFVGLISIPFTILSTGAALFVGVALATKKNRLETIKVLKVKSFGEARFTDLANTWAILFERIFGAKFLSKRQLIVVPIYTFSVSFVFFAIWLFYLYAFKNPSHSISARLPLNLIQASKDFYNKGIYGSLLIDATTIQMTKFCIRIGRNRGFQSIHFYIMFLATLFMAWFLFSIAVFIFRVADMVALYLTFAPADSIPVMRYSPLAYFGASTGLFQPQTIIHVTSRGWFSTYFMPEPLIFYCAVTAQLSLLFISLAHQIAFCLGKIKSTSIRFVNAVGTPAANAGSVIFVVVLSMLAPPLFGLVLVALVR